MCSSDLWVPFRCCSAWVWRVVQSNRGYNIQACDAWPAYSCWALVWSDWFALASVCRMHGSIVYALLQPRIERIAMDTLVSATVSSQACFHCGLPVPSGTTWSVRIDATEQPMCCPGCAAVAQSIVENGLTDFYRTRQQLPRSVMETVPAALKLYDVPELAAQFSRADGSAEATLSIEGIRCAACVWLIERRLAQVPGLMAANLNVATEKLQVRWNAAQCQPSDILRAVHEVGYTAHLFDPIQHAELLRKNSRQLFKRWFVAGL